MPVCDGFRTTRSVILPWVGMVQLGLARLPVWLGLRSKNSLWRPRRTTTKPRSVRVMTDMVSWQGAISAKLETYRAGSTVMKTTTDCGRRFISPPSVFGTRLPATTARRPMRSVRFTPWSDWKPLPRSRVSSLALTFTRVNHVPPAVNGTGRMIGNGFGKGIRRPTKRWAISSFTGSTTT